MAISPGPLEEVASAAPTHVAVLPDGPTMGNPWMDDLYRDYPPVQPSTIPPKPAAAETRPTTSQPAAEIKPPAPSRPTSDQFGHSNLNDNPFVTTPIVRPLVGASAAAAAGALFNTLKKGDQAVRPESISIPPFRIQEKEIPAKIDWIQDDAYAAYEKAYREGKPLVIMFHADWCNYCKMMDAEALKSPAFRQFAKEAVFLKLDVEKDDQYGNTKQILTRLGITEYPAIAIMEINPEGVNLRGRIVGYHTPKQFMSSFRQVMPKQITDRYPNDPGVMALPGPPVLQA